MNGVFITGTDTGIGKTIVTAGIVGALSRRGITVGVMKPVQSGGIFSNGKLVSEDAEILIRASGQKIPLELVNPYCFRPAMSPDLAAGTTEVSIDRIKERLIRIARNVDIVFVEGAGGIASPLIKGRTNGEIAYELGLPAIIVSPQRLGVINHTVLTVEYCRNLGVELMGVILNNPDEHDLNPDSERVRQTNGDQIRVYGKINILGELPFVKSVKYDRGLADLIETTIEHVNLDCILEKI